MESIKPVKAGDRAAIIELFASPEVLQPDAAPPEGRQFLEPEVMGRSSAEDGPVGQVSGTISDGQPDAQPLVRVTGMTARLTAVDPVNGADQFNWTVTRGRGRGRDPLRAGHRGRPATGSLRGGPVRVPDQS